MIDEVNDLSYNPPLEKIRKEHDFIIEQIKLVSHTGAEHELSFIRDELRIYADLYSSTMSGSISVNDAVDLPQLIPLLGEEKIKITFTRPNVTVDPIAGEMGVTVTEDILDSIDMEFIIYKLGNRELSKDKLQKYTLYFTTQERLNDIRTIVGKSFKDKPFHEVVEIIYDESIKDGSKGAKAKELIVEPTRYSQNFIACNKRPIELIQQICSRAISDEGNGSSYVFYEDQENFNFITLSKLVQGEVKEQYVYNLANVHRPEGGLIKAQDIAADLRSVQEYEFTKEFDIIDKANKGLYGSRLMTYDLYRQKIDEVEFDYQEAFKTYPHLDANDVHTLEAEIFGYPDAHFMCMETDKEQDTVPYIAENDPDLKPRYIEESVQVRKHQQNLLDYRKCQVVVSGDPRRKPGDVVEFKLPSAMGNLSEEYPKEDDKYLSGKYLVMAVCHVLLKNRYSMIMELVKDSFVEKPEYVDPNSLYEDTY
jgi:hypothetical protein